MAWRCLEQVKGGDVRSNARIKTNKEIIIQITIEILSRPNLEAERYGRPCVCIFVSDPDRRRDAHSWKLKANILLIFDGNWSRSDDKFDYLFRFGDTILERQLYSHLRPANDTSRSHRLLCAFEIRHEQTFSVMHPIASTHSTIRIKRISFDAEAALMTVTTMMMMMESAERKSGDEMCDGCVLAC